MRFGTTRRAETAGRHLGHHGETGAEVRFAGRGGAVRVAVLTVPRGSQGTVVQQPAVLKSLSLLS